jgi:predicted dehydrogenase
MPESGMYHVAAGRSKPVCKKGDFLFGFAGLDHGHAYGMTTALVQAGGVVSAVYDPDPAKVNAFREQFPEAKAVKALEEMIEDTSISMVASAAVPSRRIEIGLSAQKGGKHFFSDKPPFVRKEDLQRARESVSLTGKLWAVYYSERVHNESAMYAGELIRQGALGKVINISGFGPHRLNEKSRPAWFFDPALAGGILTDLASHQIEQFFYFTGRDDAEIIHSCCQNFSLPRHQGFHDFGDLLLRGEGGETGYFRVDWLTPDGLATWGDGRVLILGTEGYIELRKYIDITRDPEGDHLLFVNRQKEEYLKVSNTTGYPFFGDLILDCLEGTQRSMGQDYAFRVAELAIQAQEIAEKKSVFR